MRCKKGVWDETVTGIKFGHDGVSNYANIQEALMNDFPRGNEGTHDWNRIVQDIKKKRKRKQKYDCIIGISGGTDSSYLLALTKKFGLNPLAVLLDNGWSSDIAVNNVKHVTTKLNIDLETYVIDYEEVKEVLKAYIRARVPWIDNPTDQAIHSILFKIANRERLKYILLGSDFRSEGKQPTEWTYGDSRQFKYIIKKFSQLKIRSFPILSYVQQIYLTKVKGIKQIFPYYYLDYNKKKAQKELEREFGWKYYGGHHYENNFTKWAIGYWMYYKFGYDKRLITLSAQILSGEITREEALTQIKTPPMNSKEELQLTNYILKKLGMSEEEFESIWNDKNCSFRDYPSFYHLISKVAFFFAPLIRIIVTTKPKLFYEIEERNK